MKKLTIAAAIILTTGVLTTITKNNNIKNVSSIKTAISINQSFVGTAD